MSEERKLLIQRDPWWGEHEQRYLKATEFLSSSDIVLDIACGTGYGSKILSSKAKQVIGGDLNEATIDYNKKFYNNIPNLKFEIMDGTKLPYKDNTFDALISFETLEHTRDFIPMLNEFKRTVKSGGTIIISTPNFYLNSPNGYIINKYHTQEWTPSEFKELINKIFGEFNHYGQEYVRYKSMRSLRYKLANLIERIFYLKGFRKLPLPFQNFVLNKMIGKGQYPDTQDYEWIMNSEIIEKKCITQVAVVKNK